MKRNNVEVKEKEDVKNTPPCGHPVKGRRLVPRLRFPEFKGSPAWSEKKLGDLSEILRGGSPRPIEDFVTSDANGLNWLKIGDVEQNSKYVTHTQEKVRKEALAKTREVNPGDLILSNSMSFGRPYILKIKSCIHDGWIAVTKIKKTVSTDYLYYLILSPMSQIYFIKNAAGSGVQNLNADIIKLLPSLTPELPEQQKIADCLSSLDDLIAAHVSKRDALVTYKKGLMRELFPAEGERVPRLRFPEFAREPEWEEKKLGDCFEFHSNANNSRADLSADGDTYYIHYGDIHTKFNTYIDFAKGNIPKIWSSLFKKATHLKNGDLIFADASEDTIGVAKSIEVRNLRKGVHAISGMHTILLRDSNGVYVDGFKGLLRNIESVNKQIQRVAVGVKVYSVSKNVLGQIILPVPPQLEQRKIADCLSSLDDLIAAQTRKIEELKAHKKGLLQQLFPSADEANV